MLNSHNHGVNSQLIDGKMRSLPETRSKT